MIHLAIMMTFLPYVYGYRQVLPMQLLMLVFDGALLAKVAGRLGERPAGHQLHACLLMPGRTPGAIRLGPAPGARSSAPIRCGCSRGNNHAHNGTQWAHPSRPERTFIEA